MKNKFVNIGIICFVSLLLVKCDKIKKMRIEGKIKEAEELQTKGKYKDAVIAMDDAISIDPTDPLVYVIRGKIYTLDGNYPASLEDFDKAISIDPENILAYFQKGVTYSFKENYDSAIRYYNKAILQKGSDTLYFQLNKNNPLNSEAVQGDVEMPVIRFYRGMAFYEKRFYDNALNDFDFCTAMEYGLKEAHYYMGIIYISKGLNEKACINLKLAKQYGNSEADNYIEKYCK